MLSLLCGHAFQRDDQRERAEIVSAEDPDAIVNLLKTEEKAAAFYDQVTLAGRMFSCPSRFSSRFRRRPDIRDMGTRMPAR